MDKDSILFLEMLSMLMGYFMAMCCLLGFLYWNATDRTLTQGIITGIGWWVLAEVSSKYRKKLARLEDEAIYEILDNNKKS